MTAVPAAAAAADLFGLTGPIATFALIGALAAFVANRALSIYHDGVRPLVPSWRTGELDRADVARHAFRISWGFIAFFALPFTLATGVMVSHTIFLAADVLGLSIVSPWLAALAGCAWGAAVTAVTFGLSQLFALLPLPMTVPMHWLLTPLSAAFALVPAVAGIRLKGVRYGAVVLGITLAGREVWQLLGAPWGVSPEGAAALAGLLALVIPQMTAPPRPVDPDLMALFSANMHAARRGWPLLLPVAALTAWAASRFWLAGDPAAAILVAGFRPVDAAIFAILSAVGFFPLAVTTAQASGTYTTQGYCDWIPAAGYLFAGSAVAPLAGAALMGVELAGLPVFTRFLLGRPGWMELGAAIRDAMVGVLEVALLVGGVLAAVHAWPGLGALIVVGLYLLNEAAGAPVQRLAAAPAAAIVVVLLANVWLALGGSL